MKTSHRIIAVAAAVSAAILLMGGTTGCTPDKPEPACQALKETGTGKDLSQYTQPDGIAIVVANTANSALPSLSAAASTALSELMATEAVPSVWSATATPSKIKVGLQSISGTKTDEKNTTNIKNNITKLNKAIQQPPTSSGMSLFEGMVMAVGDLASQGAAHPWIIMIGSGLDDSGPMATTAGLLADDPQAVADRIAKSHPTLDLSNVTVIAQSLGFAAPPQEITSAAQRELVTTMWDKVLTRLGATVVLDNKAAPTCSVTTDLAVEPTVFPAPTVACTGQTVTYAFPAAILFDPGSSVLRDDAKDILAEPMTVMKNNPSAAMAIIGHTTKSPNDPPSEHARVSTERATAVAGVAVAEGINPSRIQSSGVGDRDAVGELNPNDRRVDIIIDGIDACPKS